MSRTGLGYAVALTLIAGGGAQAAELRFLSSWDKTNPAVPAMAEPFMKGVEAGTKGNIKFASSGPETVPPFEQLQPVSTGVFQMLFTHAVYHYGTTGIAMGLDSVGGTPAQRHDSGMYQAIDKGYQKLGLKLVAAASSATTGYHIILRAPVTQAGDLTGRKIRGTPSYNTVVSMLGGSSVVLPPGEVYSALEKGVVDGAAWPAAGVLGMRWYEVAKYMLRPGFGYSTYLFLMNLNTWNTLSDAERAVVTAEARKAEETWNREYDQMAKDEEAELIKRGMQITEMGAEQKAKLPSAWAEAQWELAEKKSGQEVKDLRALLKSKGLTN